MAFEKVIPSRRGRGTISKNPSITIGSYYFYFNRAYVDKYKLGQYTHVKFGVDYEENRYYFKFLPGSQPGAAKLIHNTRHNSYVMTIPAEIRKRYVDTSYRRAFPRAVREYDVDDKWDVWIKGQIPEEKGGE